MKKNNLVSLGLLIVLVTTMISCSSFREPKPGEPGSAEVFELAWVHPKVVAADQYYTLITSERLDSFLVSREIAQPAGSPSVVFSVNTEDCNVYGELSSVYGSFKAPVFQKNLIPGIYKLSLNTGQYSKAELPSGQYQLTIKACGLTELTRFFRD